MTDRKYRQVIYAGIGSRDTPPDVLKIMENFGYRSVDNNRRLRSGGARGADQAFERGHDRAVLERQQSRALRGLPELEPLCMKEIFLARDATPEAIELSSRYHPNWRACNRYAKMLHGRNAMIILGANLDDPVDFVYCWTKDKGPSGGTGQAIRIALDHGIRIEYI